MPSWLRWFLIAIGLLPRPRPTPAPTPTPNPPTPPTPQPAPRFMGFLFLKGTFGKGERVPLNTGKESHGTGGDCSAQTHGIVDNGTGPYLVNLTCTRLDTGEQFAVYTANDALLGTSLVPSGFFYTYPLGQRPWLRALKHAVLRISGCDPVPTPPQPVLIFPTTDVRVAVRIQNRYGEETAWGQVIKVETTTCSPKA